MTTEPPAYWPPQPAPKPKHVGRTIAFILGGIAIFVTGIGVGAAGGNTPAAPTAPVGAPAAATTPAAAPTTEAAPVEETKPAPKPAPTKAAAPAKARIEEGSWTIGEDFPAGTYKVTEVASEDCYWARMRGTDGDIIANGLGGGKPKVTLKKGETFETSNCPPFVQQ